MAVTLPISLALVSCIVAATSFRILETQPEQIHISSTDDITEMIVTWSTFNDTKTSVVHFGLNGNLTHKAKGSSTKFVDGGTEKHTQYIHRVKLTGLKPDSIYTYHCGSDKGWSPLFSFKTFPEGTNWSPRFAVFGDMGNENPQSLSRLQKEVQEGMYDAILHVGDFAYDFDFDNARVGDSFMNQIESVAAYVPYMTCPGNHEYAYNFSNYKNRFTMPMYGETENLWYSWNVGPAHIISLSTEVYFFLHYGLQQIKNQMDWLIADLKEANSPEARKQRPWIITIAHRPPYCSDIKKAQCQLLYAETVRGAFEDILYQYGVDLSFWAHEHNYERFWPLYNYTVYNGSISEPYTNPESPVHIITGSAGCNEGHNVFGPMRYYDAFRSSDYGFTRLQIVNDTHIDMQQVSDDQGCRERHSVFGPMRYYDAFRSSDYGYTRMQIINDTHIDIQQVSDDQDGKIVDTMTLIKTKHEMRWK